MCQNLLKITISLLLHFDSVKFVLVIDKKRNSFYFFVLKSAFVLVEAMVAESVGCLISFNTNSLSISFNLKLSALGRLVNYVIVAAPANRNEKCRKVIQ